VERLIVLGSADAGALARKAGETLARYRPAPTCASQELSDPMPKGCWTTYSVII
jgi:hypothetical protein